jgi:hypothetical protein
MHYFETPLPPAVVDCMRTMTRRADVQSVSFPFQDEQVWRMLVAEQVERARRAGIHLQHAFGLSGPDSGLPFDTATWGGYVHKPYEGMCEGDLIVLPAWRRYDLHEAMGDGSLTQAMFGKQCHHVLMKGTHPEVDSAERVLVEGWTLFTSRRPYVPCNPFLDRSFDPNEQLPSPWPEPI